MTPVSALTFPGPKAVAGLWSQFAPVQPVEVLVGWFEIVRVELLVETLDRSPLEPFARTVLHAVPLATPQTAAAISRLLHVAEPRTTAALKALIEFGLVAQQSEPRPPHYAATEAGRQALASGNRPLRRRARRTFAACNGEPIAVPETWGMKPIGVPSESPSSNGTLARLVPESVGRAVAWNDDVTPDERWRAVPTERIEWVPLVAVASGEPLHVAAHHVEPGDWSIANAPCFTVAADAVRTVFPEFWSETPESALAAAWVAWAKSRAVPADELSACRTRRNGRFLEVQAPSDLYRWLQANRADLFASETAVLVGDGPVWRVLILRVLDAASGPVA